MTARLPVFRVRWVILAYLFGFAFVAYMQRTSFSVAAERMMPDLGISQMQLGWLMTGYLVTYTACQLPAGAFGQWIGARKALFISGLLALAATIATPLAPMLFTGAALLVVLMLTRLLLGVGHAPVFPVAVGMIESWFPVGHWGFPNGLQTAGLHVGSAAATPIIAFAMQAYGWKNALLWSALPALLLILLWGWYARDQPAQHPGVSDTELAELQGNGHRAEATRITRDDLRPNGGRGPDRRIGAAALHMNPWQVRVQVRFQIVHPVGKATGDVGLAAPAAWPGHRQGTYRSFWWLSDNV